MDTLRPFLGPSGSPPEVNRTPNILLKHLKGNGVGSKWAREELIRPDLCIPEKKPSAQFTAGLPVRGNGLPSLGTPASS